MEVLFPQRRLWIRKRMNLKVIQILFLFNVLLYVTVRAPVLKRAFLIGHLHVVLQCNKPSPRLVHFGFYKWEADLHKQGSHLMPVHFNQSCQFLTVIIHTFLSHVSSFVRIHCASTTCDVSINSPRLICQNSNMTPRL